ncbi:AraC family transcriptional regulator, partial [Blautia obeum]
IQEISEKVGCENYLNFIRIFKNQQGTSPSQYRNNLKNNGVI